MKNTNSVFLQELLTRIDGVFESEKYKRRKTTYLKRNDNFWLLVNWQISTDNLPGKIKFTINLGVHDLRLAQLLEEEANPDIWDCHLRERIGFLMSGRQDKWWVVDSTLPVSNALVEECAAISNDYILPFMSQFSEREDLLNLWRTGVAPGQPERQRQYFISLLEK